MKRNSRSHLMGNRRWREEKEEFKTKTQFHSSHKMTYKCVEAYIIDTVTWDSCHVLAGKTPGICLEGKILIRRIISALSTGGNKPQPTNLQQLSSDWTFGSYYSQKEQHVARAVSCLGCPSEAVCGDRSPLGWEQEQDKNSFHATCPSSEACPDHRDWRCSVASTTEERLCMCVPGNKHPHSEICSILSVRSPSLTPRNVSLSLQALFPKSKLNKDLEQASAVDSRPWEFLFFI